MVIKFSVEAENDYYDIIDWYSEQSETASGNFDRELDLLFSRISRNPKNYPIVESDIRIAPLKIFPYAVYYKLDDTLVYIISIYHQSRKPKEFR